MQPFTKSQISKGNKTLAERNEVQLTLTDTSHFLHSMLDHAKTGDTIGTMTLIGKSVVILNLAILTSLYQLSKIRIPENYPQVYEQIQHSFPLIELETFAEPSFLGNVSNSNITYSV